ncbi:MAG: hypothetical protein OFPII_12170 [Osedax symbiont Rs1]|nr:MAG: hypothetical protein OFPII_12170 [Osedax symbiont Rs1]
MDIILTAVESRACAMWCSEVTDSGQIQTVQKSIISLQSKLTKLLVIYYLLKK